MKSVGEEVFIKVMKAGYIPQLGMQGPIPNPIKVKRSVIHSMIVAGIKVFEYDPETQETTEITLGSLYNEDPAKEDSKKPEAPATPDPIQPVNLQGVTAPIKEENGINAGTTPVDPKEDTPEEIKPEEDASTDSAKDAEKEVNAESKEEDKTSNTNKKKNKNKKN